MDVEPITWAEMEFGMCELGDQRRTKRLVKVGGQVLARPDGTSPDQTESWADCKALYRLMDCEDVRFEAITKPHYERTRTAGCKNSVRGLSEGRKGGSGSRTGAEREDRAAEWGSGSSRWAG